ncbi:hypothetical protein Q7C36_021572 [Tachysurus vachellii]|uniref:Uncharacterized protein n=1 Tax=Tachysurus vachellii TaxID=175792 RepID=A0AA88IVM0_TACVA|nr:hypothetical protein Q7C36_021572 [Tachysurus vachellii]
MGTSLYKSLLLSTGGFNVSDYIRKFTFTDNIPRLLGDSSGEVRSALSPSSHVNVWTATAEVRKYPFMSRLAASPISSMLPNTLAC